MFLGVVIVSLIGTVMSISAWKDITRSEKESAFQLRQA